MVGVHIAHDCVVENRTLLGNQIQLAGHVRIEQGAVVSALVGLHHFVRVGRYSYVGGMTPVRRDVPPYVKFDGDPNTVRAVNEEGLKRNKFTLEEIAAIKDTFRKLFRKGNNVAANVEELLANHNLDEHSRYLCLFVQQSCEGKFGRFMENARRDH
jgi:UDP-N-acetylglucosamine acyltransferase